ncbi:uncharacterized protein LOC129198348 isoform X2 [Grus americana]|uniref:uncharacterized protein LOC129198348 isoform X2 n=1 Tax=Grus americana TaxID=9117 RepID=UPI0024080962|nr:uncharacterized protein LOC129198348 isoform X2 [Grus americana]
MLWLLQQNGGNGSILSQAKEVPASTCSWESCLTNTSQFDIPEFKCSLNCFRLQLRQRLCEQGNHHAAGTVAQHHPQLQGSGWNPHLVRGAGGCCSPLPCGKGTTKPGTSGKHPKTPPILPTAVPIHIALSLHHPMPSPPSSAAPLALPPQTGGAFPSMGTDHISQKCTCGTSNSRKSLEHPRGVARTWCPPALPLAPRRPGGQGPLTLISAAGAPACWLCPVGWQPFAAKCYWVSAKTKTWEAAVENCSHQRSQLAVLKSEEEMAFIKEMIQNTSAAWMGLSTNQTGGKTWMWQDGSPLQKDS